MVIEKRVEKTRFYRKNREEATSFEILCLIVTIFQKERLLR